MNTAANEPSALADFPLLREKIDSWKTTLSTTDWTPWLIVALGALLRVFWLGIKPPHFDEGINGWFVDAHIIRQGFYRYDPTNYHGPLHFYVLFLFKCLFGRNLLALRLPIVIVSTISIWLVFQFERFIGRTAALLAALAMAVSTGFVFYGRYSIHEAWLVLFTILFLFGIIGLRRVGTVMYLWCIGMGVTGMILTKETYVIHITCALLALAVFQISNWLSPVEDRQRVKGQWDFVDLAVISVTGVILIIFFYSGTFFHWNGVKGLYQFYSAWWETGSNGHGHEKDTYNLIWKGRNWGNYYWLALMTRYEPAVLAGLLGCCAVQQFRTFTARYLAIYGVGTLVAYSVINYKTPWCIISIAWPFVLIFGVLFAQWWRSPAVKAVAGVLLAVSLALSIRLNYFRFTTETEPYVYVQTYQDIYRLTDPVLTLAHRDPANYQMSGILVRGSSYPLPWILGDFPRVGYYEKETLPSKLDADFLLVQEDKIQQVEPQLHDSYFTAPVRIRPYQDTSKIYLNVRRFEELFPNRQPDFVGQPAGE